MHSEQNRTIGEDLRSMMCADSLAVANSTLRHLVAFHTTAVRVYVPKPCNEELQGIATAWPNKKVCRGTRIEGISLVISGRDSLHLVGTHGAAPPPKRSFRVYLSHSYCPVFAADNPTKRAGMLSREVQHPTKAATLEGGRISPRPLYNLSTTTCVLIRATSLDIYIYHSTIQSFPLQ